MIALGWTALVAIAAGLIWKTSADRTEAVTRPGRLLTYQGNFGTLAAAMVVRSRRPCLTGWRAVCEVVESQHDTLTGAVVVVTPDLMINGYVVPYIPPELAPILDRAGVS